MPGCGWNGRAAGIRPCSGCLSDASDNFLAFSRTVAFSVRVCLRMCSCEYAYSCACVCVLRVCAWKKSRARRLRRSWNSAVIHRAWCHYIRLSFGFSSHSRVFVFPPLSCSGLGPLQQEARQKGKTNTSKAVRNKSESQRSTSKPLRFLALRDANPDTISLGKSTPPPGALDLGIQQRGRSSNGSSSLYL